MKKIWILRGIKMAMLAALGIAALTFLVMSLWNWLIPLLFKGPIITFWQALGLFVLSKILFSGFKKGGHCGCNHHKGHYWKNRMSEKLLSMTPEEREKFKQKFGNKCRKWMGDDLEDTKKE